MVRNKGIDSNSGDNMVRFLYFQILGHTKLYQDQLTLTASRWKPAIITNILRTLLPYRLVGANMFKIQDQSIKFKFESISPYHSAGVQRL